MSVFRSENNFKSNQFLITLIKARGILNLNSFLVAVWLPHQKAYLEQRLVKLSTTDQARVQHSTYFRL